MKNHDGFTNPGWEIKTKIVEELGPAGMSADESEIDEKTKKTTYRIRRQQWQARVCKNRLIVINSNQNITNAHGKTCHGNQSREQIKAPTLTISTRMLKVGCPENYYSREWVENLGSDQMVRALKWGEKKDLGSVQE